MNRRSGRRRRRLLPKQRHSWSTWGALTPSSGQDWQGFAVELEHLEVAVQNLRQRFEHIQELQAQQFHLEQELQNPHWGPEELQRLQRQQEALELQLESQLLDWGSLREPFWQAVRFGGLGIVIGWILKGIASG
jgi:hypothetical protein